MSPQAFQSTSDAQRMPLSTGPDLCPSATCRRRWSEYVITERCATANVGLQYR